MASDIIVLLLPVSSLWQLKVPLAKKIFVTLLFGTGLLQALFLSMSEPFTDEPYRACVASAMRIIFTMRIASIISEADVSHNGLLLASGQKPRQEAQNVSIMGFSANLRPFIQVPQELALEWISKKPTTRIEGITAHEAGG
ncbi:Nn.00g063090.m01.CDS01 [Neocucurbitaria sp. VM-36]